MIDHGADDVSWEQVGGELDALEPGLNGRSEGAYGQGLGQTRNPFKKHVTIGEQGNQEPINQVVLADEDAPDF